MKKSLLFMALLTASMSAQVSIGTGTAVDTNAGLSTPVSNYYSYSLSQSIYLASEISAAGNITALNFQLNGSGSIANSDDNIDVWIGHTSKSFYAPLVSATGADWIPVTGHSQVLTDNSMTRVGNTVTILLAVPFAYNGTDNLVITVDANEAGYDSGTTRYLQGAANTNKMSLMIRTDNANENADPLNMPLNFTGGVSASSVQAKNTRPVITIDGITQLGVGQNTKTTGLSVYPNPVISQLNFKTETNVSTAHVYTVTGQNVKSGKVFNNSINVSNLSSGVYMVKLILEDGTITTRKFIKQ